MELKFNSLKDLKEFSIFYIAEHDMPRNSKKILYNFVKEADFKQVQGLLSSFEFENISEGDFAVRVSKGFLGGTNVHAGAGVTGLAALAGAALLARQAIRAYKDYISKAGKQCSHIKHGTKEKQNCIIKAKKMALVQQIKTIKNNMNAICGKTKDPGKCKLKAQEKIKKLQMKIASN